MNEAHSPLPWIPSQYADTYDWGILNQQNEIMVGISSRITRERAEFICRAVNTHAALVEALKQLIYCDHGGDCFCKRGAREALRQAEEGK